MLHGLAGGTWVNGLARQPLQNLDAWQMMPGARLSQPARHNWPGASRVCCQGSVQHRQWRIREHNAVASGGEQLALGVADPTVGPAIADPAYDQRAVAR